MNLQSTVLAHLRAKFPGVPIEPAEDASKPNFDPECDCSVMWPQDRTDIRDEFERFMRLQQFVSGLNSLTEATGVIIYGMGDWPRIRAGTQEELASRYSYKLESWGQVEWVGRLDG
jgi:hypothetical protein